MSVPPVFRPSACALATGLACLSVASVARADEAVPTTKWSTPPPSLVLEGQAGGETPLGRYGLALDANVGRGLAYSLGIGVDAMRRFGYDVTPRYAAMPRYRLAPWDDGTTISGGVGLSYGKRPPNGDAATRLDVELSIEHLFAGGLRTRAFGGFGRVLDPNSAATPDETTTFYAGVGLGYAIAPNPSLEQKDSLSLGRWYGWQSLGLDALALFLAAGHDITFAGGDHLLGPHLATRAAIGTYCVSGPLVHVAHHNYGRVAASIGVRILGIATGAALGGRAQLGDGGGTLVGLGAIVGAFLGAFVDDLALAWDWRPPTDHAPVATPYAPPPPGPFER